MEYIHKKDLQQIELHESKLGVSPHAVLHYDKDMTHFYILDVRVPTRLKTNNAAEKLILHAMENAAKQGLKTIPKCEVAYTLMQEKGFQIEA